MSSNHIRIEHEGRIIGVYEDYIRVEIVSKSACASCRAKAMCTASEEKSKVVEVPLGTLDRYMGYEVGETVNVVMGSSLGGKAVLIAYAVPLVVLLLTMLAASACGLQELYVGLCGIASLVVYYIVLYFFRNSLSRVFTFSVEKIH